MATFRRHGAKLLSIGDGHRNLAMAISQFKNLVNCFQCGSNTKDNFRMI